jgi:peptidoglycan hydrolase CwlO-like protein
MIKISDIKKRSYQTPPLVKPKLLQTWSLISALPVLVVILFLVGFNPITAAPTGKPYFTYTIKQPQLVAQAPEVIKLKESLENQLQSLLREIEGYQAEIKKLQSQKRNLQNEIAYLNAQIKKAELEIKAIRIELANLEKRINDTRRAISQTQTKVERSKEFLAGALRHYYQLSRKSVIEVFLAEENLSDYFKNLVYTQKLQGQISEEIDKLQELEQKLGYQKANLEDQFEEQTSLLNLADIKKQELNSLQDEKQKVLAKTKGQESKYQALVAEKEKTAAQIRAQIYRLAGGSGPITFGEALKYAETASKLTGVRPAFLLALLHYETRIGQNNGRCNYKDAMKPSERPYFEKITVELGLDPDKMPVSCRQWYGWGGAMGPAQFLPSTWLAYEGRVAKLTGDSKPSPWNTFHAFVAAAVKLADAGADLQTPAAEWKAAQIYFAGSNWNKPSLRFYGDNILSIADRFQADIDALKRAEA